jgi:spore coat polysaccharide biosynthesis protein SpsF (cytidylyltransferase family)
MIAHHVRAGADFTYVPAILSVGILIEVISAGAMRRVHQVYQGEHITLPIKERADAFRIEPMDAATALDPRLYRPEFRLTLDEPADYEVLKTIYGALYRDGEPLDLCRVMDFLDAHPEVGLLNAHVQQKSGNLYAQELDARVVAIHGKRAASAVSPASGAQREEGS